MNISTRLQGVVFIFFLSIHFCAAQKIILIEKTMFTITLVLEAVQMIGPIHFLLKVNQHLKKRDFSDSI